MSADTYSQAKLSRAFWIPCSIVLGLILSDLTKDVIVPAVFDIDIYGWKLLLAVPSAIFCLISIVECYAWLNVDDADPIRGGTMIFHFIELSVFLSSTVAQYGILIAFKSGHNNQIITTSYWLMAYAFIIFLYIIYNLLISLKRGASLLIVKEVDLANLHDGKRHGMPALLFYIFWFILFFMILYWPKFSATSPALGFIIVSIYIISYLKFWWEDWYKPAYRHIDSADRN